LDALAFLQQAADTLASGSQRSVGMQSWQAFERTMAWYYQLPGVVRSRGKNEHSQAINTASAAGFHSYRRLHELFNHKNADAYRNNRTQTLVYVVELSPSAAENAFGIACDVMCAIGLKHCTDFAIRVDHIRAMARDPWSIELASLEALETSVFRGDFVPEVNRHLDQYLRRYAVITTSSQQRPASSVSLMGAQRAMHRGDFDTDGGALAMADWSLDLHRAEANPFRIHHLEKTRAVAFRHVGRTREAGEALKAAEQGANGNKRYLHEVYAQRALLKARNGDWPGAIELAEALFEESGDLGGTPLHAARAVTLATLLTGRGKLDEAEEKLWVAHNLVEGADYLRQIFIYRGFLRIAQKRGKLDKIHEYARKVLQLAEPRGMRRHIDEVRRVLDENNVASDQPRRE
jgi:tetratricopeptide (TPR) repeat protein